MSGEFFLLATLFVVVMGSIVSVGYVVLVRSGGTGKARGGGANLGIAPEAELRPATRALLARTLQAVGESLPASRRDNEPLRQRLSMAGYRWPTAPIIFRGIRLASVLGCAGVMGWSLLLLKGDTQAVLVPALCAAGFGYMLPDRILAARVRARGRRIRSGLPAAVDLLVLTLEAGQPLDQAMHDVAHALSRSYPDVCEEFLFFHLEVHAGKSRHEALRHLAERSPDAELKKLAALLLDGDRYGTSLGPALRTHARYLRRRIRQQAQERARKLSVKLTLPTFFLIFPAVLVVTLGPAYLQLKDSLGRLLSGF